MTNGKMAVVCLVIDCFVTSLGPRQMSHGMDYYKSRSSMSGCGLSSWLSKLFCYALFLAKKYIVTAAKDFSTSRYTIGTLARI